MKLPAWLPNKLITLNGRLFISFILICVPQVTGISLHEWLSLTFTIVLMAHLAKHWQWWLSLPKTLLRFTNMSAWLRSIWNLLLYLAFVLVSLSGFLVSESLLPAIGLPVNISHFWSDLHHVSGNLIIPMLGVHLALHRGWVKSLFNRSWKLKGATS